ncbi:MAG: histidine--tRNA ligase [Proteobacteria bacterium]|nr:MAG: histidine--tRNA ligase [Pseudomonadota bacterium]TDJ71587.1 MAG: histidine--tRNA ligase [Pseudomonadota bacterium]
MSRRIQVIRGMNDLLPEAMAGWQRLEATVQTILNAYGYREIRTPLLEKTELFARSIGQATDIVGKEMYTFDDRSGDSITLRPEATAGIVRAGIEHGLLHNQVQRLWHSGPMFRHERPQKGRYRQFHQIDVEAFGMPGPDIDAELILLTARLWRALGIGGLTLEINAIGTPDTRVTYRKELVRYLESHRDQLDEDSIQRLCKNPLRVLDSKVAEMQPIIAAAPSILDYLDDASRTHFEGLQAYLADAEIPYVINNKLVRGLDYYTHTVFEWTTDQLGAQGSVCGGGRYDGLVEELGGKPMPGTGFAIGMERLVDLLNQQDLVGPEPSPEVYVAILGEAAERQGMKLSERLRNQGLSVQCNCGGGNLKSQLRRADKSGARFALLFGEQEREDRVVSVKDLRTQGTEQQRIAYDEIGDYLKRNLL